MKLDLRPRKLLVKLGTAGADPEKIDSVKQWFQVSTEHFCRLPHVAPHTSCTTIFATSRSPCPIIAHRSGPITTIRP